MRTALPAQSGHCETKGPPKRPGRRDVRPPPAGLCPPACAAWRERRRQAVRESGDRIPRPRPALPSPRSPCGRPARRPSRPRARAGPAACRGRTGKARQGSRPRLTRGGGRALNLCIPAKPGRDCGPVERQGWDGAGARAGGPSARRRGAGARRRGQGRPARLKPAP